MDLDSMLIHECESKEEIFDPKLTKYTSEFMLDDWSPNSNDLFNSIFDPEFFNLDDDYFCPQMKTEPFEDNYKIKTNDIMFNQDASKQNENNSTSPVKPISSNSSDSGLSSDNLDMDMAFEYEPMSPNVLSPASTNESNDNNSSPGNSPSYLKDFILPDTNKTEPEIKPKVIAEKIPQIINIPTKRVLPLDKNIKEKGIKILKLSPQAFTTSNNQKIAIQLKNSNTGTKIQPKSGTILINKNELMKAKKIIPTHTTSNPRSILLPITMQDMKGVKAYKLLNVSNLKSYCPGNKNPINITVNPIHGNSKVITPKNEILETSHSETISDVESFIMEDIKSEETDYIEEYEDDDEKDDSNSPYPRLILSTEEKRLLAKEGITLPSHYPLTKYEERELKRIRRKIRNKISAQDSRKRKKEYVDGLEERVKQCTEENQTLIKKIKLLQTQNQNLMSQMKKLQTLLSKGTNKTAHPTTCLLVLLLSLALVATPNLKLGQNASENELNEVTQDDILQNRRNLLFDIKEHNNEILDDDLNMFDSISMNDVNGSDELTNYKVNDSNTDAMFKKSRNYIDFEVDDLNWYQKQDEQQKLQQSQKTFNDLADVYQKNKSEQTSGFNIKMYNENYENKHILEMMKQTLNTVHELNINKIDGMQANGGPNLLHITEKINIS